MPRLMNLIRDLWNVTDRYRCVYYLDAAHRDRVNAEHDDILAAIERRDADLAVRLLGRHRWHTVLAFRDDAQRGKPLLAAETRI